MPIRVQNDLPVKEILEQENIFVMDEMRAAHQDIRPISIGLLNLMPLKEDTELQILRALSNSPLQVDVTFVRVTSHVSKNTSTSHIYKFYEAFDDIKDKKFDGFIIFFSPGSCNSRVLRSGFRHCQPPAYCGRGGNVVCCSQP